MADVIRRAIIDVELRSKGGKFEAPTEQTRAYQEVAKSTQEVKKSTDEAIRSTREHTRVTEEFSYKSVRSFRQAGHGALQLARGLAILSASGEESLQKLVQKLVLVEGGFHALSGASKVVQYLPAGLAALTTAFHPVTLAVSALAIATGGGIVAWQRWREEIERAKRAAGDFNETQKRSLELADRLVNRLSRESGAAAGIAAIDRELAGIGATPADRRRQLETFSADLERQRLQQRDIFERGRRAEVESRPKVFRIEALEKVGASEEEQLRLIRERVGVARELHELGQQELQEQRRRALERISSSLGTSESRERDRRAAQAGFEREDVRLDKIYADTMRSLLQAMKDQQIQVNQIAEEVRQARNAAVAR